MSFRDEYDRLNSAQRQAVDTIEGPLLVIAGPGTGKTQLLSARVANILDKTDVLPNNILCLTFTESGAENMRERLTRFIGRDAYDVNVATYHGFGSDIINRHRRYFENQNLEQPVDNLTSHQILSAIVESLRYDDALRQTRHHIRDLRTTISEMKKALLTPTELRTLADETSRFYEAVNPRIINIFKDVARLPSKLDQSLALFEAVRNALENEVSLKPVNPRFGSLAWVLVDELDRAIDEANALGKPKPLTAWKNDYLEKNSDNVLIIAGELANRRLASLAQVLDRYDSKLNSRGLYDFDDMILKTIEALQSNDDLRFNLQEQYQYILLDEYQDTNAAQAKIVELLTDSPVNEGRPNVMAVGDDDQAIYAFQGAQYSNMTDFFSRYRATALINLTENYRSNAPILQAAESVAQQIESRLTHTFTELNKALQPRANNGPTRIEHRDFRSPQAEYQFIAESIAAEIGDGTAADSIAVLAPRHGILEALVPYLNALGIPVSYEKRENILDAPVVRNVLKMAELVVALGKGEPDAHLWPAVLSAEHWDLPIDLIWKLSWSINDSWRLKEPLRWTEAMLTHEDERLRTIATFFLALGLRSSADTSERMLDELIGTLPVECGDGQSVTSPLRDHYIKRGDGELYDMISNLIVLRTTLRDYQNTVERALTIEDMLDLVRGYEAAGETLLNTSPYAQSTEAVKLMTVFKAKGLEFSTVYLPSLIERLWNSSGDSNRLTLPKNLAPTRYKAGGEDENLRVFFVALTRARSRMTLTSHSNNYGAKATTPLKFLLQTEENEGKVDKILPADCQSVIADDHEAPLLQTLQTDWHAKHMAYGDTELAGLLYDRLQSFQLSPTALNKFLDLEYGGPQDFYFSSLLHFPSEPGIGGQFGNAIHETMEWVTNQVNDSGQLPTLERILDHFRARLTSKKLGAQDHDLLLLRGEGALNAYFAERSAIFKPGDRSEISFRNENVFEGDAEKIVHMGGTIDRMEIDEASKTIVVVDYKTGTPHASWIKSDARLHKYRQQLYCYKLLIEGSRSFKGYTVTVGRLEFVEPDSYGRVHALDLTFDAPEIERTRVLLRTVWEHVKSLDFPDVSAYGNDAAAICRFEDDLIAGTV
jgi:DNA helicase-2/ATP-dependent DNA helicase PcrA